MLRRRRQWNGTGTVGCTDRRSRGTLTLTHSSQSWGTLDTLEDCEFRFGAAGSRAAEQVPVIERSACAIVSSAVLGGYGQGCQMATFCSTYSKRMWRHLHVSEKDSRSPTGNPALGLPRSSSGSVAYTARYSGHVVCRWSRPRQNGKGMR